jgi:hypothetical protein
MFKMPKPEFTPEFREPPAAAATVDTTPEGATYRRRNPVQANRAGSNAILPSRLDFHQGDVIGDFGRLAEHD